MKKMKMLEKFLLYMYLSAIFFIYLFFRVTGDVPLERLNRPPRQKSKNFRLAISSEANIIIVVIIK